MEKIIIECIGFAGATLTTISFLPQIIKTLKTKSAKDVSMGMFVLFMIGVALWEIYGLCTISYPIIIANGILFVLSLTQIILKIKYDKLEKQK